jgi:hypothetical protein
MPRPVRSTAAPAWRRHYPPGRRARPVQGNTTSLASRQRRGRYTYMRPLQRAGGGGLSAAKPDSSPARPGPPAIGGGCRMKRPVLLIALLTLTVVGAASVAQAEPGLQSKLTAISGQGTGHVVVSPTAKGQGAVFVAEGAAAIHDALPNTIFIVQRAIDFTPSDGVCAIAPAPPAGWITLTTLTTSAGGAGAAHFERVAPPPGPSGFQFDIVFRVISTDGAQVLMSDCMTVTVK